MFKKIALLVLFLGVTLGVALLLYRFFFAGAPTTQPTTGGGGQPTAGGGLPTAGEGRPTAGGGQPTGPTGLPTSPSLPVVAAGGPTQTPSVTEDAVLQPQASASGLNFYDQNDGRFYRVSPDGTKRTLSPQTFPQATDVTWAPGGNKAIIAFPDESKVVYDFDKQSQVTIPSHWQDPAFNGDGSTVIAKSESLDPDNRWLVAMAADGSGTKLIEPLGENGDKVTISVSPDDAVVAFSDTGDPVGFDTRDLLPIGQNGENFKALRVEGFGFTPLWSPDDQHLLYSTASQQSEYRPSLWLQVANGDKLGSGRVNLGIETWADKCTYADAATVYCAVPDALPDGAGLQRDIADGTPDGIVRIDLKSGSSRQIGRPDTDTTIKTLTVSPDGSSLYFTDSTGALKQMRLR